MTVLLFVHLGTRDYRFLCNKITLFCVKSLTEKQCLLLSTGNTPTEGRTVDGRERETESVKRKEDKVQDWTKGEAWCQEFFPF